MSDDRWHLPRWKWVALGVLLLAFPFAKHGFADGLGEKLAFNAVFFGTMILIFVWKSDRE